ncbi:MAG: hypothetical protein Q9193_006901 [Seirophora villosa]
MSASAAPIPLERFADAIAELPLDNLHAKAAELRNSIIHLVASNEQLQEYADDGDAECADAIQENEDVIERTRDRIMLLRNEVENRGFRWGEDEPATVNSKSEDQMNSNGPDKEGSTSVEATAPDQSPRIAGGSRADELARRLPEGTSENMGNSEDGVHL